MSQLVAMALFIVAVVAGGVCVHVGERKRLEWERTLIERAKDAKRKKV